MIKLSKEEFAHLKQLAVNDPIIAGLVKKQEDFLNPPKYQLTIKVLKGDIEYIGRPILFVPIYRANTLEEIEEFLNDSEKIQGIFDKYRTSLIEPFKVAKVNDFFYIKKYNIFSKMYILDMKTVIYCSKTTGKYSINREV